MANPTIQAVTSTLGQILYSGQITATTATTLYTVGASSTVKLASGTICNTSGTAVAVTVSILKSGDTADGTHAVISGYSLAANDTLSLREYIAGAMLGAGEAVSITVGTANVIDVVLTGAVSS